MAGMSRTDLLSVQATLWLDPADEAAGSSLVLGMTFFMSEANDYRKLGSCACCFRWPLDDPAIRSRARAPGKTEGCCPNA